MAVAIKSQVAGCILIRCQSSQCVNLSSLFVFLCLYIFFSFNTHIHFISTVLVALGPAMTSKAGAPIKWSYINHMMWMAIYEYMTVLSCTKLTRSSIPWASSLKNPREERVSWFVRDFDPWTTGVICRQFWLFHLVDAVACVVTYSQISPLEDQV